jgi:dolichol-phosphate mannosyltransferase
MYCNQRTLDTEFTVPARHPRNDAPRSCAGAPAARDRSFGDHRPRGQPPIELSVVVPVHDEAENIGPLIAEVVGALDGVTEYEIVCVDDGSTDATPRVLDGLARGQPRLRVARHAQRCGQSAALHTGVRLARGPWVATLDGDGQNDPADLPRLLEELRSLARPARLQLVAGHRRHRRDSLGRRVASRVANGVRSRLLGDATPDTGCGTKVFERDAFLALPYFDHMHRFLPALVRRNGGEVVSVPVNHRPRLRGRSHYGLHDRLWSGIADLFGVMWLARRVQRPAVRELTFVREEELP